MNELLEKFRAVEIKACDRLTAEDVRFCEAQQAAYESAFCCYQELAFAWKEMTRVQLEHTGSDDPKDNLDRRGSKKPIPCNYLSAEEGAWLSPEAIRDHVESLHTQFIEALARYFNETYHLCLSSQNICDAFIPKEPGWRDSEEEHEEYHKQMAALVLKYDAIFEWMLDSFDGRSPAEQAVYELKQHCHEAAWDKDTQESLFERKKAVIRFTGWFCDGYGDKDRLHEDMKWIMRAAAYYEADSFAPYPEGIDALMDPKRPIYSDEVEFPTCAKLVSLRMFKNGRGDLKFSSPEYAEEFITKYLGKDF